MNLLDLGAELSAQEIEILKNNHFHEDVFNELYRRYSDGTLSTSHNWISGRVEPPSDEQLNSLPERSSAQAKVTIERGLDAIMRGEVGVIILNGGMATRFGGLVKGCVEVVDGVSFLGMKLFDARRYSERVQVLLMNSFATAEKTAYHLHANNYFGLPEKNIIPFRQNISLRLDEDGSLFRESDNKVSFYAPGHGDLPQAISRGALQRFIEQGGKYLLMSNVDNLLATLDPLMIGTHIHGADQGIDMTVETVHKYAGDIGGMPAVVDNHLQIVEAFRFPDNTISDAIPVFNTNTFIFNAQALAGKFDLSWFVVNKQVDGRTAIQFERLAGELSAFLETQFVVVDREGRSSRFLPIKTPEALNKHRHYFRTVLQH